MAGYIDRIEAILAHLDSPISSNGLISSSDALKRLADIPVADVSPVVHGRWEVLTHLANVLSVPNAAEDAGITITRETLQRADIVPVAAQRWIRRPLMDWKILDIAIPAERDAVAQILFKNGYTVRQRRRKDGNKTVIYIEYKKES